MRFHYVDDPVDFLRGVVLGVLIFSFIILLIRFKRNHHDWNVKTKDLWYSLLMWTFAGIAVIIQGTLLDRPLTPATICIFAAAFVTGKGIWAKGKWGSGDD